MYYVYTDIDVYTNACLYYFSESFECKLQTLCSFIFVSVHWFFPKIRALSYIDHVDTILFSNPQSVFNYSNILYICFFPPRLESHPRLCIVLSCPVSLTSFNLEEFLFHELDILEKNKSVIYRTSIWVCLMFSHVWSCILGTMCGVLSFSWAHQVAHEFDYIIGDVNFDLLVRMVSARFLHCKVTIFLYNKKFLMRYSKTV